MVILDTNIIIDHLRQTPKPTIFDKLLNKFPEERFVVSVISVQELFTGKSTRQTKKLQTMTSLLNRLTIAAYTYEIAEMSGGLMRDLGKTIGFADAAIAATTIVQQARIATLNKKDFVGIPALEFLPLL